MLAAAVGQPYEIPFGGKARMQYAPDIAAAFVAAARSEPTGAAVCDPPGHVIDMSEVVRAIEAAVPESRGLITASTTVLPFPANLDASEFDRVVGTVPQTPLEVGVSDSIARFRRLLAAGLMAPRA